MSISKIPFEKLIPGKFYSVDIQPNIADSFAIYILSAGKCNVRFVQYMCGSWKQSEIFNNPINNAMWTLSSVHLQELDYLPPCNIPPLPQEFLVKKNNVPTQKQPLFSEITIKTANAKPKHPKMDCCGFCGEVVYTGYDVSTGKSSKTCDAHGFNAPIVNTGILLVK